MFMTRETVTRDFQVKDGFITKQGPFYGERSYVPHFHSMSPDNIIGDVNHHRVSAEDRQLFPEIGRRGWIRLCGFKEV